MSSFARGALGAGLLYVALTLALTYPLVTGLAHFVPSDPGDPLLTTWILWWNSETTPFTADWFNAPAFFPLEGVLTLSEHLLGLSLVTSPIIWASDNPQLAYNVAFLLTFILSGIGGHILGWVLTGRHDAALVCGLAYAFAPYRMGQFPHIHVLASFWMPVALAALHRFLAREDWRWLLIFALAAMLQAWTTGQYGMFLAVLVGLWMLWFAIAAGRFRAAALIAAAFALAYVPVILPLLHYIEVHRKLGLIRGVDEIVSYSGDLTALFHGEQNLWLWGGIVGQALPEGQLFPGLTVVVLIAAAALFARSRVASPGVPDDTTRKGAGRIRAIRRILLVLAVIVSCVALALPILGAWRIELFGATLSVRRISRPISVALLLWLVVLLCSPRFWKFVRSQSALAFYASATLVMWVLAFGPHPTFEGQRVVYWAPYRWLMLLPGFDGIRVPARFAMLAALCLAAGACIAFARLIPRVPARLAPVVTGIVAICTLADGWIRAMPIVQQPLPSLVTAETPPGAVLELPAGDVDIAAMYRGIAHRHPVANGYSGHLPATWRILRAGLESFDPDMLTGAASIGVRHIVVSHLDPKQAEEWNAYVRRAPGVALVETRNSQTRYTIEPHPPLPAPNAAASQELPIAWIDTPLYPEDTARLRDGDLRTHWESGEPQRGDAKEHLVVGFDAAVRVTAIRMSFGSFPTTYPLYPRQLLIERSLDCTTWEPVWSGHAGRLALSAAFADAVSIPLTVQFAPVEARCIAIRQTGSAPLDHWAFAELAILGEPPSAGGSSGR